jgi:hypothetical protein
MMIEFDKGWELHVRTHIHSTGAGGPGKKQARFSIRHLHHDKPTVVDLGWEWYCRDIPFLLNLNIGQACRACSEPLPDELKGSMKLISWSMKNDY